MAAVDGHRALLLFLCWEKEEEEEEEEEGAFLVLVAFLDSGMFARLV